MRRILIMLSFMGILAFSAPLAWAAPGLVSDPLPGGSGGFVCSCINLSKEPVTVTFVLSHSAGSFLCNNVSISQGGFPESCTVTGSIPRVCKVFRADEKTPSPRKLVCTLSAVTSAGTLVGTVPVNHKLK